MAIQDFFEPLIYMEKRSVADGMGGFHEQYTDGAEFMGAITTNQTMETRIAEKQGVTALYTIITPLNVPIKYNDVIKRSKDNKYFRITSNPKDMETPKQSTLNFYQMTGEEYHLPN